MTDGRFSVGTLDSLSDGQVKIVTLEGREVGVVRVGRDVRAYENRCPHQGGPVCYGEVLGHQEAVLNERQQIVGERLSTQNFDLVCPWHGWSYDVRTGENIGDRRFRLRAWTVAIENGEVYISSPAS